MMANAKGQETPLARVLSSHPYLQASNQIFQGDQITYQHRCIWALLESGTPIYVPYLTTTQSLADHRFFAAKKW